MVLYAAADAALEIVPERDPPGTFSARPITAAEAAVRQHFSKQHIYFIGAHTGCSCGFAFGNGGDEDDEGRASVRELRKYLERSLASVGPLELYACWDGEESEPTESRTVVQVSDFSADAEAFELEQRAFAIVSAGAA